MIVSDLPVGTFYAWRGKVWMRAGTVGLVCLSKEGRGEVNDSSFLPGLRQLSPVGKWWFEWVEAGKESVE